MELRVSLDDSWAEDYEATVAQVIKEEICHAIRQEVKKVISDIAKEHIASIRTMIEAEMKRTSSARKEQLLLALEKANNS